MFSLAIGTFALGVAEFGMMGFLGDVADSFEVSVSDAGHLISAYSLGVAIGSPGLIVLRRMPLRRLMVLLASMIFIGNVLVAVSPCFHVLLAARFIAGLPHGAFFGAGAIVCSRIAGENKGASAVAVLVGGMTVANLVGVPGATFISNMLSWRIAFACVAFIGLLAVAGLRFMLPPLAALPDMGMKGQFRFLSKPEPWLIYAGVFFGQASVYTWLSYVQPVMTDVTGFTQDAMTWIMMLVGGGMVVGNFLAGKLSDKFRASKVTAILAASAIPVMLAVYFCAPFKVPSMLLAFIAPGILFGIGGPLQYLIVKFAKGGEMLGGAGIQIAFNVSNSMAAALGGAAISMGLGLAAPALAGIPCAIIGSAALFILTARCRARNL